MAAGGAGEPGAAGAGAMAGVPPMSDLRRMVGEVPNEDVRGALQQMFGDDASKTTVNLNGKMAEASTAEWQLLGWLLAHNKVVERLR